MAKKSASMAEQRARTGRQLGLYVPVETAEKLKLLSDKTDIPQSRLLRQALQLLFEKYADELAPKSGRARSRS
jgi:predicted DNA-binding protein